MRRKGNARASRPMPEWLLDLERANQASRYHRRKQNRHRPLMLFDLQLLGKPDANGNPVVVESRADAGASVEEAARTAKNDRPEMIVQNTSLHGTCGFRLIRNGLEVFFRGFK